MALLDKIFFRNDFVPSFTWTLKCKKRKRGERERERTIECEKGERIFSTKIKKKKSLEKSYHVIVFNL